MEPSTNNILRDRGLALQAIACARHGRSGMCSARRVGLPLHRLWGSVTDSLPMSVIGGYYHLDLDQTRGAHRGLRDSASVASSSRSAADRRRRMRSASARRARRRVPTSGIMVDANQGYERAQAVEFGRLRRGPRPALVRGALPLDQRPALDARRAAPDRHPGRGRAERDDTARHPRPRRRWRHRRQQLRRLLGWWTDHLAQGGRAVARRMASSWATTRSPRSRRISWRRRPNHTFVECFDEERDPFFWALSDLSTFLREGRLHLPERPGFGTLLDWDYVERYTVDRRTTDGLSRGRGAARGRPRCAAGGRPDRGRRAVRRRAVRHHVPRRPGRRGHQDRGPRIGW